MRQGKCPDCKVKYDWKKNVPKHVLACPECGGSLWRTTHQWKGKVIELPDPPYRSLYSQR
jgi:NAD-dependent SIR2 family protein deacetylase